LAEPAEGNNARWRPVASLRYLVAREWAMKAGAAGSWV